MHPLVTIITPTTGAHHLARCIDSVQRQTYKNIQHLLVIDGHEHAAKVAEILNKAPGNKLDIIALPYPTGKDRYNGHRIYGAMTYLSNGDFICFLDEDNWYDTEHIESLLEVVNSNKTWAFSLRKIVDANGTVICNDDCESLGLWESCMGDYFVDVGCYFLPRALALQLTPLWHRKAREPGVMEVDRALMHVLRENNLPCDTSGKYTLNYRTGNTSLSVRSEFFLNGNAIIAKKYAGTLPWRK
jgi:glycosyltransferase involved in cell wall biosynthesis